jgi:protein AATF/BFR2
LRKPAEILLGPEYSGARITRDALDEDSEADEDAESGSGSEGDGQELDQFADPEDVDIDMDDEDGDIDSNGALGESDIERFKDFTFRGSSKPKSASGVKGRPTAADFMTDSEDEGVALNGQASEEESDEDMLGTTNQQTEDAESENGVSDEAGSESSKESDASEQSEDEEKGSESESEDSDDYGDDEKSRRAELRNIMSEEQKTVVATISQAAKADADKGNAVKEQRKAFDSLLGVRMVLQKALVATNSMTVTEEKGSEEGNQPYEAAEEAAIKLWNTLDSIRHDLQKATSSVTSGQKRKRDIDSDTPTSAIWERMQNSEVAAIDNRQSTLEKWSAKIRGTAAIPVSRKLNPTANQQSITSVLQDQLASSDHLIQRTKIPRSCAPIQRDSKATEDPNIYDDGNFYQMLLKELVDQRRVESLTNPINAAGKTMQWTAVKEAKTRKVVDTKASKGRKMRFTVHEKLQNFMAPEDRRSWEAHAIDGFFGSLLGQKMSLGEEDSEGETEEGNGVSLEEEGLMLFRS